jgi:hypothetical protein
LRGIKLSAIDYLKTARSAANAVAGGGGGRFMKTQRTAIILIIVNLALLGFQFARGANSSDPAAPVIRARAIELVDDAGRVRAELKVLPAQPDFKMPDGTKGYPEAVQLRLITSQNNPNVKLVATEDGAGLSLGGKKGHVQILSRGADPFVKIVTKDGREKTFQP